MRRVYLRNTTLLGVTLLLGTACSAPAPVSAQGLAARVEAAPGGTVRFHFPAREGVCGSATSVGWRDPRSPERGVSFYGSWNGGSRQERAADCRPGALNVALTRRSGARTELRASVGAPAPDPAGTVTDLGAVPAVDAARYLVTLAERGEHDALLPAALAEGYEPGPDLVRLARTSALDEEVRHAAVLFTALFADRASVRELHRMAEDRSHDEELRGHALFALSQTHEPEDAAFLRAVYPRLGSEELREKAIFAVSQTPDPGGWLLELALDRSESESLREKAVFWLAESPASLAALDDLYARLESGGLREQVIFAYSRRDEPAATQRLLRIARSDPDEELRGRAIFWLGQAAGEEITAELAGLAREGGQNREVQEQAIFALSQRPRAEGVPALLEIARAHRDPEIRRKALFWLGQSRDPRALDLFAEILGEP